MRHRRLPCIPCVATGALLALAALTGDLAAQQAVDPSGKTLVVAPEHAAKGEVFYLVPGKPGEDIDQTRFTNVPPNSKKKVDNFTGRSNEAIGYLVASSGEPGDIVAGAFHLPVASLSTQNKTRDKHIRSKGWLNAKKNPNVVITIKGAENIEASGDGHAAELIADVTIKGQTREMRFPVEIARASGTAQGDLLRVTASYSLTLSDFGVKHKAIGKRMNDTIRIEQYLVFSDRNPGSSSGPE